MAPLSIIELLSLQQNTFGVISLPEFWCSYYDGVKISFGGAVMNGVETLMLG